MPTPPRNTAAEILKELTDLQQGAPSIDWRRERPHPEAPELRAAIDRLAHVNGFTLAEWVEARARVHLLQVSALDALAALAQLPECNAALEDFAYTQILNIANAWDQIRTRLASTAPAAEVNAARSRAERILRNLVLRFPEEERAMLGLLQFMRKASGIPSTLAYLGRACSRSASPGVASFYFDLLIERLERTPNAEAVEGAEQIPIAVPAAAFPSLDRFRFERAVHLASLRWNAHLGEGFGDDALRAALAKASDVRPGTVLEEILGRVALLRPREATETLLALTRIPMLWKSAAPEMEAVRFRLLEHLWEVAEALPDNGGNLLSRVLHALLSYLPQTIRYWEEPQLRLRMTELMQRRGALIHPHARANYIAQAAFGSGQVDLATENFALATELLSTGYGHPSYLDYRAVGRIDAEFTEDEAPLASTPFRFEILHRTADPGARARRDQLPLIMTSANVGYVRSFLSFYARGLAAHAEEGRLHLHLVGERAEIEKELAELRAILPGFDVTLSSEPVTLDRAYYFASARFIQAARIMDLLEGPLILTDIDLAWRMAPEAFLQSLRPDYDVAVRGFDAVRRQVSAPDGGQIILRYAYVRPWVGIAADIVVFANTAAARRFAELLRRVTATHLQACGHIRNSHWGIDQNITTAVYTWTVRAAPETVFANVEDAGFPFHKLMPPKDPALRRPRGAHWISYPELERNEAPQAAPA
ncbi:hypothetical protein QMO56_16265 [Roseomonas sp. E05]|uniref:hypothetical protein n=1 Tax=Roseomonas sp. E05 TaxID=3046310 RepID=UPI0024BB3333|nr:hypothetical protein [Roseomonas sp. E05]MDJ0389670.1 hypothetical protein [Roseomonas sp. E05]